MIFQILGPMLVAGDPAVRLIPGGKPRQLLATLLLHPNRFVSSDYIADNLWDGRPPGSASANLRTYVRTLRARLSEQQIDASIETRPGGYALLVSPDALDTTRAEALISEGRHLTKMGDPASAAQLFDDATTLWRGAPLEDVPVCSAWQPQLSRWENTYTELLDEAIRVQVDHGDPRRAAELVRDVLDRDPYNENLWCLLMQCHLAAGQPQAASAVAREGAALLDEELGVEVGPEFASLAEQARNTAAPAPRPRERPAPEDLPTIESAPPRSTRAEASGDGARRTVPTQLPIDSAGFRGRTDQVQELTEALRQRSAERPFVAVVFGPPGIGKTALAIRVAHETREAFPDGQIFLNLRGASSQVDPSFAVSEALSALGVQTIPEQVDRAAALLRSELASRRVLMVVDDVGTAGQVSALIPGTGDSAVLVTSRRRLTDVISARFFQLDVLDEDSALQMAAEIAPARDRTELQDLVRACGLHPLAIRIAAARLSRRADLAVAVLVGRLSDPDHALNELTLGELAFRSTAALTSRSLDPVDARGFRALGALDLGAFPGWAVDLAAESSNTLDVLLEENLLQSGGPGDGPPEYRMHDLLRWHAREWGEDHHDEVRFDVRRVLLGWLVRAGQARDGLPAYYAGNAVAIPADAPWTPPLDVSGSAWFAGEQARLTALLSTALRSDCVDLAWRLACTWSAYFDFRGHTDFWLKVLRMVQPSTHDVDDPIGEATVLRDIGQVLLYRDDPAQSITLFERSIDLFTGLDQINGVGFGEIGLGASHRMLDQADASMEHFQAGLQAFRDAGNRHGEALALNGIASVLMMQGSLSEAEPLLEEARALATEIDDRHRVAQVLRRMGNFHDARGDLAAARAVVAEALEIFAELGDHRCAGLARSSLGSMLLAADDLPGARREYTQALAAGERADDAGAQAEASEALAHVNLAAGRTEDALRQFRRSIRSWQIASRPADAERVQERVEAIEASPESMRA